MLADGVAMKNGSTVLVEVELTAKRESRYQSILTSHARRLASGQANLIRYVCTIDAARVVARMADQVVFRDQRGGFEIVAKFDEQGRWVAGSANGDTLP